MYIKTNFSRLLALAIGLLFMRTAMAQTATIDQVMQVELRNSGSISQGDEVKAYYMFYKEDKIDRKTNQYRLRIMDANLADVTNESIVGPNSLYLLGGTFNGAHLMLKFIDLKEEQYQFRFYDTNGKFVKQIESVATKIDVQATAYMVQNDELFENSVYPVGDKGFINIKINRDGKIGHEIQYFAKDRGFLGWTYKSDPASKMNEFADFILADDKLILIQVVKKKTLLSGNMDGFLVGIDAATGKKKFETPLHDATNSFFMLNGLADTKSGNYFLFGQFSELGDNSLKDNSLGFVGMQFDATGKAVNTTKVTWEKDVAQFLPVNYKGKIKDIGYVYFHKIVKSDDGRVYAIGEQYKKAISAGGVALNALSGGSGISNFKVVVQDMMVFEFSPEFKLEGVSVFEKGKTNVALPQGAGANGPHVLALYVKMYGGFDYCYTQVPTDNSRFTVCLTDWEKEKGEKGRMTFKSISRSGDNYVTDKIDLVTEATSLRVLEAKPGYVLISEYHRKLKKVDLHLEKFNE